MTDSTDEEVVTQTVKDLTPSTARERLAQMLDGIPEAQVLERSFAIKLLTETLESLGYDLDSRAPLVKRKVKNG